MATDFLRWLLFLLSISAIASVLVWVVWGARTEGTVISSLEQLLTSKSVLFRFPHPVLR